MLEQNNLELRKKAYEIIQRKGSDISLKFENSDLKTLLHELDVYQAELEAQNEELRDKEAKLYNSQLEYESLFMDATMGFVLLDNKLEIQNINNMARAYFAYRFLNEKNKMFISLIARNGIESFFNWIDKKEYLKKHLEIDLLCDSGAKSFRLDAKPYLLKDKWIVLTLENIENEKLFALKRLENYKAVLYTLADLIEKRDPYTAGHSKRVATYAKKIANKMHLPKEKCDMIYEAGILHDIGKIVIPDSILLKPSRLNDNEFKIIKQHSSIGYELLSKVNDFNEIANIIHFHHERVDGLGYPKGLKSNEIPLESKILAVADTFDSMTTNRIYEKRRSVHDALEELNDYKNIMYDSNIVDVAIEVLSKEKIEEDISQNPISQMESARFSYFYNDQLTHLYNINYLDFIINQKFFGEYNYFHVLSLKNFSEYNKKFGWIEGDRYLKNVATILKDLFIDSDNLVFRVFGDDFVVLTKDKNTIDLENFSILDDEIIKIKLVSHFIVDLDIHILKDIDKLGI